MEPRWWQAPRPLPSAERNPRPVTFTPPPSLKALLQCRATPNRAVTKALGSGLFPETEKSPSPSWGTKTGFQGNVTVRHRTPVGTAVFSWGVAEQREGPFSVIHSTQTSRRLSSFPLAVSPFMAGGKGVKFTACFPRLLFHLSGGSDAAGGNWIWYNPSENWQLGRSCAPPFSRAACARQKHVRTRIRDAD